MAESSREADRAIGAVFGAFIGDAAGAVLEFGGTPNELKVEKALKFEGGGILGVGPGQITDDSEMAMCIMHGLTDKECALDPDRVPKVLNLDGITHYFGKWSINAFDIGYATSTALSAISDHENKKHLQTRKVFSTV